MIGTNWPVVEKTNYENIKMIINLFEGLKVYDGGEGGIDVNCIKFKIVFLNKPNSY